MNTHRRPQQGTPQGLARRPEERAMAVPKIAINGFGRIGRIVTRIAKMRRHFDVVAINDLTDPEHLAYLFKYDSVHGVYPGDVRLDGDTIVIDNDPFQVLSERDPAKLPWRALGVDYVIDSTVFCVGGPRLDLR